MPSRLAQLAARLDALSRGSFAAEALPRIGRWGAELAVALPPGLVASMGLRDGDAVEFSAVDATTFAVAVRRPPAGG